MESGETFIESDFANNLSPDRPGIASANRCAVSSRVTHGGNAGKRRAIKSREVEKRASINTVGGKVKEVSESTAFDVQNPTRWGDKLRHVTQGRDRSRVVLMCR